MPSISLYAGDRYLQGLIGDIRDWKSDPDNAIDPQSSVSEEQKVTYRLSDVKDMVIEWRPDFAVTETIVMEAFE